MSDSETRIGGGTGKRPYVDLVLGAWRPWEAATQLAAALGVTLPPGPARALSACDEIDDAAVGDPLIFRAHAAAARVAAALPAAGVVVVLTPRFGLPLRHDNEWFFLFLKRRGIAIVFVGDEPEVTVIGRSVFERRGDVGEPPLGATLGALSPAQERLLRFFPGLLPRSLAEKQRIAIGDAFLVPVGPDHFLIPPGWRDSDPREAAPDLDAMADLEAADAGLASLAQRYCTAHFADSATLCGLSAAIEEGGALDIASELAERARQVARTPAEMATADIRRQEIRRRLGRAAQMLALPPPSRRASNEARHRLDRLKLGAALAVGRTAGLHADLGPLAAKLGAGEPMAADDLLLLDDYAVALAADEPDRALALAEQLRAALDGDPEADRRLVFRNAMTLARLCRGDPERHRAMLDRAFATSAGLRSLGEVVEMNVLRASAEADPTSPAAQLAWLRATLAWLAFGPPEAAPAGIVAILLGEGADYVRARLDIDISETIADRMAAAWPRIEAELGGEYPAVLVMTEAVRPKRVLGGSGASIGWMESSDAAPTYVRPRVRLVRLVEAALATLCPALADLDRGVFLVDTNLGLDIPATRDEALSVALRTKADELVFGTEHVPLDAGARARIANGLVVRLSDTVVIGDGDDRLSCRFRRHRPEAALAADQAEAIAPLRDNPRMPLATLAVLLGRTLADTERLYRAIEALGILRIVVENSGAPAAEAAPTVEKE